MYQVGSFPGHSWREWNGRFRDDLRSFFRGDEGMAGRLADRVVGSPQIYAHKAREAEQSINFVTCHDGFTLNDLVSYSRKHNKENGEGGRDGSDDNRSSNWGAEGPSDNPGIESLRNRMVKNLLAVTLVSLGIPMILMGDEVRRTQSGNNNAWCQDNETSWFDWDLLATHADVHRFVRLLTRHRLMRVGDSERLSLIEVLQRGRYEWNGVALHTPDWSFDSHSFAVTMHCPSDSLIFYFMLNGYRESLDFELPDTENATGKWRRWIDTSLTPPRDIQEWDVAEKIEKGRYAAGSRSVAVLFAQTCPAGP